ncbi:polysaccharide pyruvyl transferase family protein [Lysinibacillus sp. NPDC097231]|uniref:polysaccharide pyruvyl transferase family protein n=1 Tax=Lysinibacillus sp. NPDC097231 TaxID=3364142 RepID=UPI00380AC4BE
MKKKLKVLHIASFIGNIGDNANHIGFKYLRDNFLDFDFVITEKEIRGFYWREWIFNSEEFVKEANEFDLVVIGGGNYFELWVNDSETGTSIDLGLNYIKQIKTPILFYALGCDLGQGVEKGNIEKFEGFLDYLTSESLYFVSVRNDGAITNIKSLYDTRYEEKISEIPDGGFFTQVENLEHYEIEKDKINILINIAGDMSEIRFSKNLGEISYETFINNMAEMIESLSIKYNYNLNIIFVPHIFRDLKAIYDVLDNLNDKVRRNCIKVAPYLLGEKGHNYIFSLYNQSDLIIGMRFHSNVVGYALKKNVIGLVNYIQIKNLYKSIESEQFIDVRKVGFSKELEIMIIDHLSNNSKYIDLSKSISEKLKVIAEKEFNKLNKWLKINFGK